MISTLKKLRPDHWAWLNAKLAMIIWSVLFFVNASSSPVGQALQFFLTLLVSGVVFFGLIVSAVGLLMATSKFIKTSQRGTTLELAGLYLALSGPVSYFIVRVVLVVTSVDHRGSDLAVLSYAVAAFIFVRIVIISSHRKKVNV